MSPLPKSERRRWWDGCGRTVVSTRTLNSTARANQAHRNPGVVETLDCGHEQMKGYSQGIHRICNTCVRERES